MITLSDELGLPVPREGGRWTVEEARRYQISGAATVRDESGPLPELDGGVFLLEVRHQIGRIFLEWSDAQGGGQASLDVLPRAEKLSAELWLTLVEELEAWLPSATLGMDGARHGGVGGAGVSAGWLAEALLPLIPLLLRATAELCAHLRVRAERQVEDRPLYTARQVRRDTLTWIGRHPDVSQWLDPERAADLGGAPPAVPLARTIDTLDHPANRYVHWLLARVASRLGEVAGRLDRRWADDHLTVWCASRASALRAAAERLRRTVRRSPLHAVPMAPATDAAMSVVLDDPRYARVHALARRFLSPRFALTESDTPASVRPSYGVYELWCLRALERALTALPGFTWERHGYQHVLEGTGAGARLVGRSTFGKVELRFNQTFASYVSRSGQPTWSLSGERRPDFVIGWLAEGEHTWVALDAKYRVGANLIAGFESAHLYRDALRWDGQGGAARAAVLLCPATTPDTTPYFMEEFRAAYAMGAFVARPGTALAALTTWIAATLGAR